MSSFNTFYCNPIVMPYDKINKKLGIAYKTLLRNDFNLNELKGL